MIWSVSTLLRRSGTAVPVWTVNFSMLCRSLSRLRGRRGRPGGPVTAVAAATGGETRWVRPPRPCRPSKLRLDVDAERSPGRERVRVHAQAHRAAGGPPLGAGGGEDLVQALQLGLLRDLRPSRAPRASGRRRRPCGRAARRPRRAGPRCRPLVQEPRKTVSTATSRSGVPGVRPMYASARSAAARSAGSANCAGSGTPAPSGTPWPGLVPQVTNGLSAAASSTTSVSKVAPGVGAQRPPVRPARRPSRRPAARAAGP